MATYHPEEKRAIVPIRTWTTYIFTFPKEKSYLIRDLYNLFENIFVDTHDNKLTVIASGRIIDNAMSDSDYIMDISEYDKVRVV